MRQMKAWCITDYLAPFADDVEDRIFKTIRQVLKNTGIKARVGK